MIEKNKIVLSFVFLLIFTAFGCTEKKAAVTASLKEMTASYPSPIRQHILSDSTGFLELMEKVLNLPPEMFVMADKKHALGENFIPKDLVKLADYPDLTLSRKTLLLRKVALPDLRRMSHDAQKAGITIVISSTYRSYRYQKMLFNREVKLYGLKTAERESARPGTSQHQLGVAIDFGSISDEYAHTPAGKWLMENAWKYGFSLSYPAGYEWLTGYRSEVWHYRYITPLGTELQRKYFDNVQQYMLMFIHDNRKKLTELIGTIKRQ